MTFPAAVAPFILGGVIFVGIDNVMCLASERRVVWR